MITVFVGQRGTGKTSLLNRLRNYYLNDIEIPIFIDLDLEIERITNTSVGQIFKNEGEIKFRMIERKFFSTIILKYKDKDAFISVGAGFDTSIISEEIKVIWVQRLSDESGRVFLNRPALETTMTPLEEFFYRTEKRKINFKNIAWEEYLIPEGMKDFNNIERQILIDNPQESGGILTLLPHQFKNLEGFKYFIKRRLGWGFSYFEIRDDLLTEEQIELAMSLIPPSKVLWSRRVKIPSKKFSNFLINKSSYIDFDRDLFDEHFDTEAIKFKILSVHNRKKGESLSNLLENLSSFETRGFHLKLAIDISDFKEFKLGYEWYLRSPKNRSFLPRSQNGRWLWYRLWKGTSQFLNFLKEGEGSSVDQPTLYQWIQRKKTGDNFAAIIGKPVNHSFTPVFQWPFFENYGASVFAIEIDEDEFNEAIDLLNSMGLIAAAITSPLKIKAMSILAEKTQVVNEYQTVNTIVKNKKGQWVGHNTDIDGLAALISAAEKICPMLNQQNVLVWGGGGTLPLIKKLLPNAQYYSVQTGLPRNGKVISNFKPEWVIWASGRYKENGLISNFPSFLTPNLVVDLNYREDSGGRELARLTESKYLSGEIMFYTQGIYQQEFWQLYLDSAKKE